MPGSGQLRAVLGRRDFRRLFATRVAGQFADGLFQAGLAGSVLFNPERRTDAVGVALGFALVLLPYSAIGPFVGVLLDRWSRRHVLVVANLARSAVVPLVAALLWSGRETTLFLLLALVVIGVNRFFLAGLSASLPHVVRTAQLLTANAVSTTSGTVAFASGIGAAVGLRALTGASDRGYATVAATSVVFYLLSALLARGFAAGRLGPGREAAPPRLGAALADAARGVAAGLRHVAARRGAAYLIAAVGAHRVGYGVTTIATLLLLREGVTGSRLFPAGGVGLGQVVVATAAGALAAAMTTPVATRRAAPRRWVALLLAAGGLTQVALIAPYLAGTLVASGFVIGFAAQGVKLVADTAVQAECDDAYVGRVFSVYDTLFNTCLVAGMVLGALTLPEDGRSHGVLLALAAGYAALGAWYALATAAWRRRRSPVPGPA